MNQSINPNACNQSSWNGGLLLLLLFLFLCVLCLSFCVVSFNFNLIYILLVMNIVSTQIQYKQVQHRSVFFACISSRVGFSWIALEFIATVLLLRLHWVSLHFYYSSLVCVPVQFLQTIKKECESEGDLLFLWGVYIRVFCTGVLHSTV